jgi:hypothetical protein
VALIAHRGICEQRKITEKYRKARVPEPKIKYCDL